jgi:5-(carboxyamino)imidazole ribonucleotide synthase
MSGRPAVHPGFPLPPGSTIGVVGGGQLGRMLALAAARLGLNTAILAQEAGSPAGRVAAVEIVGAYGDAEALMRLAAQCDVVTFEFENVPADALSSLEQSGCVVSPPRRALAVSQDRLEEKTFLNAHGLTTAPFAAVNELGDLYGALDRLGSPALLKTRRDGYDGKGQIWIHDPGEAAAALENVGRRPAILEGRAPFVRELSVIAARSRQGDLRAYPLSENQHDAGVLRRSVAPAEVSAETAADAQRIAFTLLQALDYVGVIGVELFELDGGRLWVNEFAPRVHNTGHWTLDGCEVDQFEQHIRAVAGWPLGPSAPLAGVEMINLLGEEARDWLALASDPHARLWLYGKDEDVTRRKMGHVNRLRPLRPPS